MSTERTVTAVKSYDKRRVRVVLDDGDCEFLLYLGECRRLHLTEGMRMTEADYHYIVEEILKPRARKKVLYALKDCDKTRAQLLTKLKQGGYPQEVIDDALAFLEKYRFVDDGRYAENYVASMRGKSSKREIEAKLRAKGISRQDAAESLAELMAEDEYTACRRALCKYCGRKTPAEVTEDRAAKQRAYAYLARKGYSFETIEHAFLHAEEE